MSNRADIGDSIGAWGDRHLRVHACLSCLYQSHVCRRFGFERWNVSTIALNFSITGQTLDRNIGRGKNAAILEVGLVEGRILRAR
jgi:hypothetical protein